VQSEVHPLHFVLVSLVSKDGFAMKKILSLVALFGFICVLGCNDAKTSSSSTTKTQTTTTTDKKDK